MNGPFPQSDAPVVSAVGVTRRFGTFTAVDGVDLAVRAGEIVGLLGANGAGKTTLIRMILGLLTPTSGSIRLFGRDTTLEQRRRIGYVPQNLGLYPDLTVAENLEFRARIFADKPSTPTTSGAVLVGALSHGLQRRVAFTAALQHQPDLLVLDEPTSGVSPLARSRLWDLIRNQAERGAAVLVSTHYMDEVVQADRLVVMTLGRVVATGSTDDVIGDRSTVTVVSERWADAFALLDGLGRDIVLAGRTIRLPGSSADEIRELFADAGLAAAVDTAPATLDEAMVDLSR